MPTQDKIKAVQKIVDHLNNSDGIILTEYRGLKVQELRTIRMALASYAIYSIVKNKLATVAAKKVNIEGLENLNGPSAIAFIKNNIVEAAKSICNFAKNNEALIIKGGYYDGKVLTGEDIKKFANIESREVTLAKFAGCMQGCLSKAAAVFPALLVKNIRTINALKEKKEKKLSESAI